MNARFPTLPFTLRAGDERAWRMGVVECVKHNLFVEYPVLYEKDNEFVAQVKFTVALLPSGNVARTTSSPPPVANSEKSLTDEALVGVQPSPSGWVCSRPPPTSPPLQPSRDRQPPPAHPAPILC